MRTKIFVSLLALSGFLLLTQLEQPSTSGQPEVIPIRTLVEQIKQTPAKPLPPLRKFTKSEIECLARNLYHEARGEPVDGIIAVAWVTYNRKKDPRFGNNICSVVYQKAQFSWTLDQSKRVNDWQTYNRLYQFAERFLNHSVYYIKDVTNGSTFYHKDDVSPRWTRSFQRTTVIGRHIFYRRDNS